MNDLNLSDTLVHKGKGHIMKVGIAVTHWKEKKVFSSLFFCIRMCTNAKGRCCLPTSLAVVVMYLFRCSLALPLKSSLIHSANIYQDPMMYQALVYIFCSRKLQYKCFCVDQGPVNKQRRTYQITLSLMQRITTRQRMMDMETT